MADRILRVPPVLVVARQMKFVCFGESFMLFSGHGLKLHVLTVAVMRTPCTMATFPLLEELRLPPRLRRRMRSTIGVSSIPTPPSLDFVPISVLHKRHLME